MAYITIRLKGVEGHTLTPIERDRVILGRASSNDIQLAAEAVSRQHCCIYRFEDAWFVEDMNSSNGTRVLGEKITKPYQLEERSVIKCGHARLTFHLGEMPTRKRGAGDEGTERISRIPSVKVQAWDPIDAFRCGNCNTWVNCSHHIQGDHMSCPRCGEDLIVPNFLPPEVPAAVGAAEEADEQAIKEDEQAPEGG